MKPPTIPFEETPAPGTNQFVGFGEFRPLSMYEKLHISEYNVHRINRKIDCTYLDASHSTLKSKVLTEFSQHTKHDAEGFFRRRKTISLYRRAC